MELESSDFATIKEFVRSSFKAAIEMVSDERADISEVRIRFKYANGNRRATGRVRLTRPQSHAESEHNPHAPHSLPAKAVK